MANCEYSPSPMEKKNTQTNRYFLPTQRSHEKKNTANKWNKKEHPSVTYWNV